MRFNICQELKAFKRWWLYVWWFQLPLLFCYLSKTIAYYLLWKGGPTIFRNSQLGTDTKPHFLKTAEINHHLNSVHWYRFFSVVSNGVSLIYIVLFWTQFIGTRTRLKWLCSWIWHPVTINRRMDFVLYVNFLSHQKTSRNTKFFEKGTNHITLFLRSVGCSRKNQLSMFFWLIKASDWEK